MGVSGVPRPISPIWKVGQAVSVTGALAVVALLLVRPEWGLFVTWSVLIPLVPALLLVAPMVWRNLCPIAVVHQLPRTAGRGGRRRLSARAQWWAPAVAAVGLALIVPLRLTLFNHSGLALAAFVVGVLGLALAGGLLFAGKAGWCASWCPVGVVERLYGQRPIAHAQHAHCAVCVGCTDRCFDRDGPPAVARLLGEQAGGRVEAGRAIGLWRSPMGVFAGAFPGFVLGYFTAPAGAGLGAIYAHVATLALASLGLFVALQVVLRLRASTAARAGAAAAASLYYWFTVPAVFAATEALWGFGPPAPWIPITLRAGFLLLVVAWFVDAPRRVRSMAGA